MPSPIGLRAALSLGQTICQDLSGVSGLMMSHRASTAVAGGYLRDVALGRYPKDLDVFLDGHCNDRHILKDKVEALTAALPGAKVVNFFTTYDKWTPDIDVVCQIGLQAQQEWGFSGPTPETIDLIVLNRYALECSSQDAGGSPAAKAFEQSQTFLEALLHRIDLRINTLGATVTDSQAHRAWNYDALYNRLVARYAKLDDLERVQKRLTRLRSTKFPDWTIHYEGPTGELLDEPPTGTATDGSDLGHGD